MPNALHPFSKFLLAVIEVLLAARIIFKLIAYPKDQLFIYATYNITDALIAPVSFVSGSFDYGRHTFEFKVVAAMILYLIIGYVLIQFIRVMAPSSYTLPQEEEEDSYEEEE